MKKEELMARLAGVAYKRDSRIKEELKKLGFKTPMIRVVKDLKYFISTYNDEIYIGIRGSVNKRNWVRNFNFFPKKKTHRGFRKGSDLLFKDIEELKLKDLSINISAHSLGASLALLLGIKMGDENYNIKSIYGFGCPRVFTKKKDIDEGLDGIDCKSFVNNLDVVTQLPPVFPFGYEHKNDRHYINHKGGILVNPSDQAIALDRIDGLAEDKSPKELYKDHEISYYVKLLQ